MSVTVQVDGRAIACTRGDTAASAALKAGLTATRSHPVTGAPRAPYCLMGVCFDCLMTIDGQPGRRACMVPVRDGMVIEPGTGRPDLAAEP